MLAKRVLDTLQNHGSSPTQETEFNDELWPCLERMQKAPQQGTGELLKLVQALADNHVLLRQCYTHSLGRFCVEAVRSLTKSGVAHWHAAISVLRLLESVLLPCMVDSEDRPLVCEALQQVMKSRMLPRQALSRLETAFMSLVEPEVRRLYAPEVSCGPSILRPRGRGAWYTNASFPAVGDALEGALAHLAESLRPTKRNEEDKERAFKLFDDVIYRRFGVHGRPFGSSVNGFQLKSSDIDISVILPSEVQDKLLRQASETGEDGALPNDFAPTGAAAATSQLPSLADWKCMSERQKEKAASVAATRALSAELKRSGFEVTEVIEAARVPIVRCRHSPETAETEEEIQAFEVDISFCNEVAYYNSRLLRCYADFDARARALVLLVKLWAKRRRINSPFDGTLSSYSYSLMSIHYLQRRKVLPNLQWPRTDALMRVGKEKPDQKVIEGGHNVWFLEPPPEDVEPSADGEDSQQVPTQDWLGCESPGYGLRDLLYGFFRYFAVEFNSYANVVSIRWPENDVSKANYFAALIEKDVEQEANGAEANPDADEDQEEADGTRRNDVEDEAPEDEAADQQEAATPLNSPTLGPLGGGPPPSPLVDGDDLILMPLDSPDMGPRPMPAEPEPLEAVEDDEEADEEVVAPWLASKLAEASKASPEAECLADPEGSETADAVSEEASTTAGGASTSRFVMAPRIPPTKSEPIYVGTVKSFHEETGFGFLSCPATYVLYRRDVFLHYRQMKATGLQVNDRVCFKVELNSRGQPQARQVNRVDPDGNEITDAAIATGRLSPETPAPSSAGSGDTGSAAAGEPAEEAAASSKPLPPGPGAPLGVSTAGGAVSSSAPPPCNAPAAHPAASSFLVQKRLGDRLCLCIDDPMEKNRTLGTSFSGHELLSYELLRALSILKNGGEKAVQELFREREPTPHSKRRAEAREFSPIPMQTVGRSTARGSQGLKTTTADIWRPIPKELIGRIIGPHGKVIRELKAEAGLDEARIHEKGSKQGNFVSLRGTPDRVEKALQLLEEVYRTGKIKSKKDSAGYGGKGGAADPAANALGLTKGPVAVGALGSLPAGEIANGYPAGPAVPHRVGSLGSVMASNPHSTQKAEKKVADGSKEEGQGRAGSKPSSGQDAALAESLQQTPQRRMRGGQLSELQAVTASDGIIMGTSPVPSPARQTGGKGGQVPMMPELLGTPVGGGAGGGSVGQPSPQRGPPPDLFSALGGSALPTPKSMEAAAAQAHWGQAAAPTAVPNQAERTLRGFSASEIEQELFAKARQSQDNGSSGGVAVAATPVVEVVRRSNKIRPLAQLHRELEANTGSPSAPSGLPPGDPTGLDAAQQRLWGSPAATMQEMGPPPSGAVDVRALEMQMLGSATAAAHAASLAANVAHVAAAAAQPPPGTAGGSLGSRYASAVPMQDDSILRQLVSRPDTGEEKTTVATPSAGAFVELAASEKPRARKKSNKIIPTPWREEPGPAEQPRSTAEPPTQVVDRWQ
eukprot:TRINITY_DN80088_c0_g1_i1.p1 TRINITY_DN80088_c0_g1~~TRINITY_DN80088_c0_g1_i1.p1  ORF type:complete len:1490 (+),score=369.35 TRINITY_DN80088_c0_g1_i1:276-4745(+)